MDSSTMSSLFLQPLYEETIMDYAFEKSMDANISTNIPSNYFSLHRFVIRCLSIYALALVIIGTLGNILTIIVLCRRNLRRYVTMRYLIAVSVCDIISLYGWNLNNFYKFTISPNNNNLEEISLVHCRVVSYLTFVGLQLSSWCLTVVSLDRCLSLHFLTWKQKFGKLTRTKYYVAILTITCLLLNSHILFFNGYRTDPPNSTVKCYATRTNPLYIFPNWERVHLVVYNLCPFIIMLLCNMYIIYITIRSARIRTSRSANSSGKGSRPHTSRHRQLSLMLMIVTFAFVLLTLPSCLYFVFFRHRMPPTKDFRSYRHMVQICLSSVQFTSHAVNFFLYCFTATNFRNELRDLIKEICFHRSTAFKPNKSFTSSKNTRKNNKLDSESTLEYQQTGQNHALKEMQTTLINQDLKKDFSYDIDSTSN